MSEGVPEERRRHSAVGEQQQQQQQQDDERTTLLPSLLGSKGRRPRRSSIVVADLQRHPDRYRDRKQNHGSFFPADELIRNRSHLSSYPSIPDPKSLERYLSSVAYKRSRSIANIDDGTSAEQALEQGAAQGVAGGPEPETSAAPAIQKDMEGYDSRFTNTTPLKFYLTFTTILLGYFVACFDTTLMASSHPVITSYFNASSSASWLTTAFMITNTGLQPLWGRLSDTVGRKSVFMLVLFIFAATNFWCGLCDSIGSFIAARALCGLGAGGTMSMGLVILNDLVYVEYRGIYISHVNLTFGLGSACGAAFGGLICDKIGWRWSFGLQVPVLALCMLAANFTVPNNLGPVLMSVSKDRGSDDEDSEDSSPAWTALKNFDSLGLAVLLLTVTFLILFLNLGGNIYPWSHWSVITSLVLSVLGSIALVFIEGRAKQPVMPLHLLTTSPTGNLTASNFLASIASNTVLFNAPLWFQAVKLTTPTASGLRLASPAIGGSIAGVASGYIITYTARLKPILVVGSVVYLAGSIALCLITREMGTALSIVLITGAPLAQGFIYPGSMMSAFSVSGPDEQAVVTTTVVLWRNLGIVVGVAVSSLVFQNMLRVKLEEMVHGKDAEEVIRLVRNNVGAIKALPIYYRDKGMAHFLDFHRYFENIANSTDAVIDAYANALKVTFITAVAASVLLLLVVVPCKLPRLRNGAASAPPGE